MLEGISRFLFVNAVIAIMAAAGCAPRFGHRCGVDARQNRVTIPAAALDGHSIWIEPPMVAGDGQSNQALAVLLHKRVSEQLERRGLSLADSADRSEMQLSLQSEVWGETRAFYGRFQWRSVTHAELRRHGFTLVKWRVEEPTPRGYRWTPDVGLEGHAAQVAQRVAKAMVHSPRLAAYLDSEERIRRQRAGSTPAPVAEPAPRAEPEARAALATPVQYPEPRTAEPRRLPAPQPPAVKPRPERRPEPKQRRSAPKPEIDDSLMDELPGPDLLPEVRPGAGAVAAARTSGPSVVAIFDIEDSAGVLQPEEQPQLSAYLSTRIAERIAYRVVPRSRIRELIEKEKAISYGACFDASCQIELGKALAAERSISTRILRIGKTCAIASTIYDLRTETAEAAVSVKTGCGNEQLLKGVDELVEQLRLASLDR